MATFTATVALKERWNGFYWVGPAGTAHTFPDALYEEFMEERYPVIPGCSVTYPTEGQASISVINNSSTIYNVISGTSTTGVAAWVDGRFAIELVIDNSGNSVSTGFKGFIECPCNAVITGAKAFGIGVSVGSAVFDVWKDSYANYPPLVSDSICGSSKITISGSNKATDQTLTGWTTTVTAGDIIGFNLDSVSGGFTGFTVSLTLRRV